MRASDGSPKETPEPPKDNSTVILLLGTMADTTWRMFIPSIIGIAGGYFLDEKIGTAPWMFIVGTVLGCTIAGLLIKRQLQNT